MMRALVLTILVLVYFLDSTNNIIPYISFTLPGYGIAIDVEKNSTILDFQFVIDNPLQSLMPEPGDEVFLLRYLPKSKFLFTQCQ